MSVSKRPPSYILCVLPELYSSLDRYPRLRGIIIFVKKLCVICWEEQFMIGGKIQALFSEGKDSSAYTRIFLLMLSNFPNAAWNHFQKTSAKHNFQKQKVTKVHYYNIRLFHTGIYFMLGLRSHLFFIPQHKKS